MYASIAIISSLRGSSGEPFMLRSKQPLMRSAREMTRAPRERWTVPTLPEHLGPGQRDAVRAVADAGVVVLTGGPGTGKSTVVHEILQMARAQGVDVMLAAPTGRAAKRLEQTTKQSASTVHRLLEVSE